jgi:hypothetical protein
MRRLAMFTALAVAATTAGITTTVAEPPNDPYDDVRRDRYRMPLFDDYVFTNDDVYIDRDRPYRYERRFQRDFRGRWIPIAEGYAAESGRVFIKPNLAGLRKLRIEGVRGAPVIQQVKVEYFHGIGGQTFRLGTRLAPGSGEVLDLHHNRGIRRIIVYPDPRYRGRYSVFGA